MTHRVVHSEGTYAHYVTFSCFKRRKLLNPQLSKQIVIGTLGAELTRERGICLGFVVMPDHAHALIWFSEEHRISGVLDKWKDLSSRQIYALYEREFPAYFSKLDADEPIWQRKYYGFNVYSEKKVREKLNYMHNNPVRAGLVKESCDWLWSSARFWHLGKSVGIPISFPH